MNLKHACDALLFLFFSLILFILFILLFFNYYFIVFYFIKIVSICIYKMCKYEKYVKNLLLNFVILKVKKKIKKAAADSE